jgi:serine/threonine protein kinase
MSEGASDLIGRTLGGRFRVTSFLGEGAMASVFRAEQDADPREVAVKVMHRELLRDETFAKRFVREAKAAAKVVHPNSVRILEHGADGDALYLAMELLDGQDLFDTLVRERKLTEERAARIVIQVAAALESAHAHGIVHRDLKPENVMLIPDAQAPTGERVKVLDFGIAKIMERDHARDDAPPSSEAPMSMPPSSALTRVGTIVGTPEYMAPEQAMGLPVDARSDVYSCGVLLYHMITGRQPFTGPTPIDVIVQVVDASPALPSAHMPDMHPALEKIVMKAIAKMPDERYQTASDLRAALEALLPELPAGARRTKLEAPTPALTGLPGVPAGVTISGDRRQDADKPPSTKRSSSEEKPAIAAPESDPLGFAATMKSVSATELADAIEAKRAELEAQAEVDKRAEADEKAEADEEAEADKRAEADEKAEADRRAEADEKAEADKRAEADEKAEAEAARKAQAEAKADDEKADDDEKPKVGKKTGDARDAGSPRDKPALFASSAADERIAPAWVIAGLVLVVAAIVWAMRELGAR